MQDLAPTYLAHHELESKCTIVVIVYIVLQAVPVQPVWNGV